MIARIVAGAGFLSWRGFRFLVPLTASTLMACAGAADDQGSDTGVTSQELGRSLDTNAPVVPFTNDAAVARSNDGRYARSSAAHRRLCSDLKLIHDEMVQEAADAQLKGDEKEGVAKGDLAEKVRSDGKKQGCGWAS
jgi:hypothetical protein